MKFCEFFPCSTQLIEKIPYNLPIQFFSSSFEENTFFLKIFKNFFRFCDMVLSFPLTTQQPVMMKLQQTFAYLRYTLRAIYSPSDLLKSARPPWFESGRQQDCSEFLRYLLDTLQEQEQSSARNVSGGSVFREHRVIEPPPPNKSGTTSESSSSGTSSEDVQNKVVEPPNKSVSGTIMEVTISNHRSSECLDAISEAPETVPEVDPEMTVPDVDMISQGADEDFMFGSRNSLSHSGSGGIHTKLLEDNPELMGKKISVMCTITFFTSNHFLRFRR